MEKLNKEEFERMCKAFFDNGFQLYYVGGYVRSFFTQEEHTDVDMATNATPSEMIKLCNDNNIPFRTTKNGIAHGTVVINGFEITTFRKEVAWDGHNATVQFAKTIEEDLSRRDFTMNAMAINVQTGELLDPFDGKSAIEDKIIMTVGNSTDRLKEDPLRALRAVRFANQLQFNIELGLKLAIWKIDISSLSQERIRDEFIKILKTRSNSYLWILGLLNKIIPEFKEIQKFDGGDKHNETVDKHSLICIDRIMELTDNPNLMLVALLHDIGKGRTANNPERKFKDHEDIGGEMAQQIMERLKFPTDDIKYVTTMIREHMRWHWRDGVPSTKALRRAIAVIGEENIQDMLKLTYCDNKANLSNSTTYKFDIEIHPVWIQYQKMKATDTAMKITDLAINGNQLITLGFKPSPLFSEILEKCLDAVSDGLSNDNISLINYVKTTFSEHL